MLLSPPARFIYAVACVSAIMSLHGPHTLWLTLWFWAALAVLALTLIADVKVWWLAYRRRNLYPLVGPPGLFPAVGDGIVAVPYGQYPPLSDSKPITAEAEVRGYELLLSHLNDAQQAEFALSQRFRVTGSRGGRYMITSAYSLNVSELDDYGRIIAYLCVKPMEPLPTGDRLLAQKLLLEADEARYWATANVAPGPFYATQADRTLWAKPPWERRRMADRPEPTADGYMAVATRQLVQQADYWERQIALDRQRMAEDVAALQQAQNRAIAPGFEDFVRAAGDVPVPAQAFLNFAIPAARFERPPDEGCNNQGHTVAD